MPIPGIGQNPQSTCAPVSFRVRVSALPRKVCVTYALHLRLLVGTYNSKRRHGPLAAAHWRLGMPERLHSETIVRTMLIVRVA